MSRRQSERGRTVVPATPREIDGVSVVVKGHFNPAIFSPAWLLGEQLIGVAEYKEAKVEIISRDLALFSAAWLACQVTPDALQMSTVVPEEFERTRDVVAGVLRALSHTPIGAMGVNREVHVLVESVEQWHALGDRLVPKDAWLNVLSLPGMRNITIWGARTDDFAGRVHVQVEPSLRIPRAVYITHNDHYLLAHVEAQPKSRLEPWLLDSDIDLEPSSNKLELALEILATDNWNASLERADAVFRAVMEQAK